MLKGVVVRDVQPPFFYILLLVKMGRFIPGVTSILVKRVWEHKTHAVEWFTQKYTVTLLVYYELHEEMLTAIAREKQIKAGSRAKKIGLIAQLNPEWNDLYAKII